MQKLTFAARAQAAQLEGQGGLRKMQPDEATTKSLEWISKRTPRQVMNEREEVISAIEKNAAELVASGQQRQWLLGADQDTAKASATVNGPLAEELAARKNFQDAECVQSLRDGAPALGDLPRAADAAPQNYPEAASVEDLRGSCRTRDEELLKSLHADEDAAYLLEQTLADAKLGRMTRLVRADSLDLGRVLLGRRFSREQGTRADGSAKLRQSTTRPPTALIHAAGRVASQRKTAWTR